MTLPSTGPALSFKRACDEFEAAWREPRHTPFEMAPVDVNLVLADRYVTARDVHVTRAMLWDFEVRKAEDPAPYIPGVITGTKTWARRRLADGSEHFFRSSDQLAWLGEGHGQVLEEVFIDHQRRQSLFLGRAELPGPDGGPVQGSGFQPLFHVEHGARGAEDYPLSPLRVVFLTPAPDRRLTAGLETGAAAGLLPGSLEILVERDLGIGLRRR